MNKTVVDNELFSLAEKYSDNADAVKSFTAMIKSVQTKEIIIPVLGMQGMGKSTLINGILGENILPNEADETTCVPVEVKFGEDEHADVFFKNNSPSKRVFTNDELAMYVDNNYNPANEKQVSHIVLYRKNELLKSGLIIVDLPGIGSLTAANEETTNRYIENLCTAIFVIPTNPTIRRREAVFIKSAWMQFPMAVFVQNHWDESKREVEESIDFNSKVLRNIASEINADFNDEIIVVNAYNALYGALNSDDELVNSSNIKTLVNRIRNVSENWDKALSQNLKLRILGYISTIRDSINRRIAIINQNADEYKRELQREYDIYKDTSSRLNNIFDEIRDYLSEKEDEIEDFAKAQAKDCAGYIRSEIFRIIDSGVTDGDNLTQAFEDIQSQKLSDFSDACSMKFLLIQKEIRSYFEEIEDIVKEGENKKFETVSFYKKHTAKPENLLPAVFNIAAGVGGLAVVNAMVQAGTISTAFGPIGFAVGAVITIVGSLIGVFLKSAAKKKRAQQTKSQISSSIDNLEKDIRHTVIEQFEEYQNSVKANLDAVSDERKKQEKLLNQRIFEEKPADYNVGELQCDLKKLDEKEAQIKCQIS